MLSVNLFVFEYDLGSSLRKLASALEQETENLTETSFRLHEHVWERDSLRMCHSSSVFRDKNELSTCQK